MSRPIRISHAALLALVLSAPLTAAAEPGTIAVHARLQPAETQGSRDGRFGLNARLEAAPLKVDPATLTLEATVRARAKGAGPTCAEALDTLFLNGFESP